MPTDLSQFPSHARSNRNLRLIPLLLAVAVSQAYAAPIRGTPGTPGTDGTAPGAAGTNGGAAPTLTLSGDLTVPNPVDPRAFDLSGFGGAGGAGGNGAEGGAAGGGGRGADVNVTVTGNPVWFGTSIVNERAFGGIGGAAGTPGLGGARAVGGAGGNGKASMDIATEAAGQHVQTEARGGNGGTGGGAGGMATAALTAHSQGTDLNTQSYATGGTGGAALELGNGGEGGNAVSATTGNVAGGPLTSMGAGATGGDGGSGSGVGHRGGHGGTGSATLNGQTGAAETRAVIAINGGAGGAGLAMADGGNGGAAILRSGPNVSATGALVLRSSASGGVGGDSEGGRAGAAGIGDARLTLDNQRATRATVIVSAYGGRGGSASGASGVASTGARGIAQAEVTARAPLTVDVSATGGAGGNHASGNGQAGGQGEAASVARGNAAVVSNASATGGDGGRAVGSGNRGGAGASATATAAGYGTTGKVEVSAQVKGGTGGAGSGNAHGGNGAAAHIADAVTGNTSGTLVLKQIATAGAGGAAYTDLDRNASGGQGGNASSRLRLTNDSATSIDATVSASGGTGGRGWYGAVGGNGGAAEAELVLRATAAGSEAKGTANAYAGGVGLGRLEGRATGDASARVTVEAARRAVAEAGAMSEGFGSHPAGGNTTVLARAVSAGEARADAHGNSTSATGTTRMRAEAIGGSGTTYAQAYGRGRMADVSAYSSAVGATGNSALAHLSGPGKVAADSVSTGTGDVTVHTGAQANLTKGDWSARTAANVGGAIAAGSALEGGVFNYSYATATPNRSALAAVLGGSPEVAAALADGRAVGVGAMGARYPMEAGDVPVTSISSANFQFSTAAPGYLTLGLFNPLTMDTGFTDLALTISNHGTQIFARSFDSLADAQLFFGDHALGLGLLGAGTQDLLVTAQFTLGEHGGFGFHYALGVSAVPEPQTWMLMLLGSVFVFRAGRRKA